jgi:NOL1/NOP2/fmu family ribosome biogenesis protein
VAAKLVRPGGYLLYSTCTFAPEEDEGVINGLLSGFTNENGFRQFEVVALPQMQGFIRGKPEWLESSGEGLEGAVRLFPHRVIGEGHFACLLKRAFSTDLLADPRIRTDWHAADQLDGLETAQQRLWQAFVGEVLKVDFAADRLRVRGERLYFIPEKMPDCGNLRVVHPGVWLGTFKKERFEPAHPLALFLKPGQAQNVLDLPSSVGAKSWSPLQAYLRGETIPSDGAPGWLLITVDGWPLGWGKRVQGIIKNHFPRGWNIN